MQALAEKVEKEKKAIPIAMNIFQASRMNEYSTKIYWKYSTGDDNSGIFLFEQLYAFL